MTTVSGNVAVPPPAGAPAYEWLPLGLAVDSHGTFFLAYPNGTIRQVKAGGAPVVIGGVHGVEGSLDGSGTSALFQRPWAIAVDAADNLYVLDARGTTLRKGQYLGIGLVITAQPVGATVVAGSSVTFSVTANGTPAPQYQWRLQRRAAQRGDVRGFSSPTRARPTPATTPWS